MAEPAERYDEIDGKKALSDYHEGGGRKLDLSNDSDRQAWMFERLQDDREANAPEPDQDGVYDLDNDQDRGAYSPNASTEWSSRTDPNEAPGWQRQRDLGRCGARCLRTDAPTNPARPKRSNSTGSYVPCAGAGSRATVNRTVKSLPLRWPPAHSRAERETGDAASTTPGHVSEHAYSHTPARGRGKGSNPCAETSIYTPASEIVSPQEGLWSPLKDFFSRQPGEYAVEAGLVTRGGSISWIGMPRRWARRT